MPKTLDDGLARRLEELHEGGLRRELLTLSAPGVHQVVDGQTVVSFASNDYLGLCSHETEIREVAGASASRLVVGNLQVHEDLEKALADYVGLGASLLFSSGYAANVGSIPALVGRGDVIFSDELNHASLIDGARLSGARIVIYPHGDLKALRGLLQEERGHGEALVLTEAVFSMDGDCADLRPLRDLATDAGAWLYVDEAHSLGLVGPKGAGLCAEAGIKPDGLLGTLGKSFGTQGAFVAGSHLLREWLIHRARSFVFSTGLSPHVSRATLQKLELVRHGEERRAKALALADELRSGLRAQGLEVLGERSAITSVILGSPQRAVSASEKLLARGYLARAIRPPTVPKGTSRIRIVTSAAHTTGEVQGLIGALGSIMENLKT